MKITRKQLKNMIRENLRDMEGAFFGPSISFLLDNPDVLLSVNNKRGWLRKNIGNILGAGHSREVYEISDHLGLVLKVAIAGYYSKNPGGIHVDGIRSNSLEAKYFNLYPDFFPKTYVYDKNFTWIVIERLHVITSEQELSDMLNLNFEVFANIEEVLLENNFDIEKIDEWVESITGIRETLRPYMFYLFLCGRGSILKNARSTHRHRTFDQGMHFFPKTDNALNENALTEVENVYNYMASDIKLLKFQEMVSILGVDPIEMDFGNLGVDREGNIKIIDISIF
tara:strand:+ start:302 stop:1150 length:849 start_codon:yes stop_codon:yes gene_type:complete